jgi:hypothetical protein
MPRYFRDRALAAVNNYQGVPSATVASNFVIRKMCALHISASLGMKMKKPLVLALLLAITVIPVGTTRAADDAGSDHVIATYRSLQDCVSLWTVAEMVCCHCYKRMPDGTRFYYGVREVESCRSYQGGYCAGYEKCFP